MAENSVLEPLRAVANMMEGFHTLLRSLAGKLAASEEPRPNREQPPQIEA